MTAGKYFKITDIISTEQRTIEVQERERERKVPRKHLFFRPEYFLYLRISLDYINPSRMPLIWAWLGQCFSASALLMLTIRTANQRWPGRLGILTSPFPPPVSCQGSPRAVTDKKTKGRGCKICRGLQSLKRARRMVEGGEGLDNSVMWGLSCALWNVQ